MAVRPAILHDRNSGLCSAEQESRRPSVQSELLAAPSFGPVPAGSRGDEPPDLTLRPSEFSDVSREVPLLRLDSRRKSAPTFWHWRRSSTAPFLILLQEQ